MILPIETRTDQMPETSQSGSHSRFHFLFLVYYPLWRPRSATAWDTRAQVVLSGDGLSQPFSSRQLLSPWRNCARACLPQEVFIMPLRSLLLKGGGHWRLGSLDGQTFADS